MGAPVKVQQPDSGQLIDGVIVRIIDSSMYTVGKYRRNNICTYTSEFDVTPQKRNTAIGISLLYLIW